jgi:nucleoside-diphosphate kinase
MVEKTLFIIKPDATEKKKIGAILKVLEDNGFDILALKMIVMTRDIAKEFYVEHLGKDYCKRLIDFMTSGKSVAAILEKDNAVSDLRRLNGETDPRKASPGTLRQLYGENLPRNAVHASDSPESGAREISILFPEYQDSR